jgi:hypothetical protein
MNEDDLYDLDDSALEAAFKEAKSEEETSAGTFDEPEQEPEQDLNVEEPEDDQSDEVVNEDSTENDEEDDGLENLDDAQDSDQTSDKEDEEGLEEDDSETSEDDLDEGSEEEEEKPESDKQESDAKSQPAQNLKYKANGKEYEFTQDEVMKQFPKVFGQAMDYTRKMQAIKPWRKTIDAIEQAELNHDDVSLMIDVLKGDKSAISTVLNRTGVDTLDLDTENVDYVPKSYGRDESTLAIKDVVDEISQDPEYQVTHKVLASEWDDNSWGEMSKDPQMIKLLHQDVKSGMFNKVQPIAEKLKLFDNGRKSDLDYYKLGAQEYFREAAQQETAAGVGDRLSGVQQQEQKPPAPKPDPEAERKNKVAEAKKQQAKRKATKQVSEKRKAAAPSSTGPSKPQGVTDYLEDTDEAFEEWYKNLKDNM